MSPADEAQRLADGYTRGHRVLEITGIAAFFSLLALCTGRLVLTLIAADKVMWLWTAMALLAGLLAADLVSGIVHWAADNWGTAQWPLVGASFIRPFRHHHVDPEEMTRHDFVELNGNNCIVSIPAFLGAWATIGASTFVTTRAAFLISLAFWVFLTNQFHAWAHTRTPPSLVRWLQSWSLILTPRNHDVHHTFPHAANYCITTGWMNPVLTKIRFFETLEWIITGITGVLPVHAQLQNQASKGTT